MLVVELILFPWKLMFFQEKKIQCGFMYKIYCLLDVHTVLGQFIVFLHYTYEPDEFLFRFRSDLSFAVAIPHRKKKKCFSCCLFLLRYHV